MNRAPGLRVQLLGGLSLIIGVASISVGVITVWTMRQQVSQIEMENAKLLGQALANVLSISLRGGDKEVPALQRAVASIPLSSAITAIQVVDRNMRVLVSSHEGSVEPPSGAGLAAAVNTGQQVVRIPDLESHILAVSTPIFTQGKLTGGVRLHLLLGPNRFGWPRLFWLLMVVNGLVLVLFVALVVTRYVIRPVEAMQRAAAQASEGDLSVRLAGEGARELASLASSFNEMTAAVQNQLSRLERQRQELATSREVLIRSEKLASVGRLAAGVAHEVGNPLQSIVGFTEIMLSGDISAEERADFLQRVRHETERIHHIIRELLDFARPMQDEPEPVKLAQVVEQSLQLVGPQRRLKAVAVKCEGLEEMPPVASSSQRLIQVLVNLLLNAADAMKGEGRITIVGTYHEAEGMGEITVSNDGPPILEQHRDQIFDPFFTTKDPGQGTGLGLSVACSIIERHGGTLELMSGNPPTFSIQLPIWKE